MPELPIEDLTSPRTAYITKAFMLCYPDLDQLPTLSTILYAKSMQERGEPIPQNIAIHLIDAPSYTELATKTIRRKSLKGSMAGDILIALCVLNTGKKATPNLSTAYKEVKEKYDNQKDFRQEKGFGWSEKKMKEAWKTYKPISPLWAASIVLKDFRTQIAYGSPQYMLLLFSISEQLIDFGEALILKNKKNKEEFPLFNQQDSWRIPQSLRSQLLYIDLPAFLN